MRTRVISLCDHKGAVSTLWKRGWEGISGFGTLGPLLYTLYCQGWVNTWSRVKHLRAGSYPNMWLPTSHYSKQLSTACTNFIPLNYRSLQTFLCFRSFFFNYFKMWMKNCERMCGSERVRVMHVSQTGTKCVCSCVQWPTPLEWQTRKLSSFVVAVICNLSYVSTSFVSNPNPPPSPCQGVTVHSLTNLYPDHPLCYIRVTTHAGANADVSLWEGKVGGGGGVAWQVTAYSLDHVSRVTWHPAIDVQCPMCPTTVVMASSSPRVALCKSWSRAQGVNKVYLFSLFYDFVKKGAFAVWKTFITVYNMSNSLQLSHQINCSALPKLYTTWTPKHNFYLC